MTIPKTELSWVRYNYPKGVYIVTSDKFRFKYTLWKEIGNNDYEKIMTSDNPEVLDEKVYNLNKTVWPKPEE